MANKKTINFKNRQTSDKKIGKVVIAGLILTVIAMYALVSIYA